MQFLAGIFIGLLIVITVVQSPSSNLSQYRAKIEECEKSLPRDQHCTLIAIPVDKE